jgi:tetratricopeptide (TPR) repeat protein
MIKEATTAAQNGDLARAEDLAKRILDHYSEDIPTLDLLGFIKFFQGDYATGEALCRRVLDISPDHAYAHKGLGLHLARLERVEEGIANLKRATTLKPDFFDPYWDLAVVYYEKLRYQDALDLLQQARERFPPRSLEISRFERNIKAALATSKKQHKLSE